MHRWEGHADQLAAAATAAAALYDEIDAAHHDHAVAVHGERQSPWETEEPDPEPDSPASGSPTERRTR